MFPIQHSMSMLGSNSPILVPFPYGNGAHNLCVLSVRQSIQENYSIPPFLGCME